MESLNRYMAEYKKQIRKGDIVKAYRGLMDAMTAIKNHLVDKHPGYSVPGSLYFGYMDMTYFAFTPADLRGRNLKIAIVFVHETGRFDVWLAAGNRRIKAQYVQLFKERGWDKTPITKEGKGVDAIVESVLDENPDFDDMDALAGKIEKGTLKFIRDIQEFLNEEAQTPGTT